MLCGCIWSEGGLLVLLAKVWEGSVTSKTWGEVPATINPSYNFWATWLRLRVSRSAGSSRYMKTHQNQLEYAVIAGINWFFLM